MSGKFMASKRRNHNVFKRRSGHVAVMFSTDVWRDSRENRHGIHYVVERDIFYVFQVCFSQMLHHYLAVILIEANDFVIKLC